MPSGFKSTPPSSGKVLDEVDLKAARVLLDLHTIGEVAEYHEISVLDLAHQLGLVPQGTQARVPKASEPRSRQRRRGPRSPEASVRSQLRRL